MENGNVCLRKTLGGVDLNRNWPVGWKALQAGHEEYGGDPDEPPHNQSHCASARILILFQRQRPIRVFLNVLDSRTSLPGMPPYGVDAPAISKALWKWRFVASWKSRSRTISLFYNTHRASRSRPVGTRRDPRESVLQSVFPQPSMHSTIQASSVSCAGERPLSEPQSRILRDLGDSWRPHSYVQVHSGEWAIYTPWVRGRKKQATGIERTTSRSPCCLRFRRII